MPTPTGPTAATADQLFSLAADGYRYELIAGEIKMMSPAGGQHGRVASQIAYLLKRHVDTHHLGVVYAAETGFLIQTNPDTVLAPDAAFVSTARHRTLEDETGYLPLAPDLAVEVISPNDRFSRVEAKALTWLDAGTKLVLLIDPAEQTIHAYRSRKRIDIYHPEETVDCSDAVRGWQLTGKDVFELKEGQ